MTPRTHPSARVTWTNASGNLPGSIPAFSIVTYKAGATRVLVAGTEIGVFFSTNEGTSWTRFNAGLPVTQIAQLSIDRDQTTIAAFTGGRGAFSTNIGGGSTPCTFSIAPTSASFASAGGNGSASVTAPAGCAWTASSNASWITVTNGASGSGNGTVSYAVASNASTSSRSGTLTVAGQTHTVSQSGAPAAGCTVTAIDATTVGYPPEGASYFITFAVSPAGCAWTATAGNFWIDVFPTSGNGNGGITISVGPNPTSFHRFGNVNVSGTSVQVIQEF